MDKILVVGLDTVLGANLAACLANRYQVVGLSPTDAVSVAGCETAVCEGNSDEAAQRWIAAERPAWVVYCGAGAVSTWTVPSAPLPRPNAIEAAGCWARAAQAAGCEFTLISSDAVFTGPWMFHRESGSCFCESAPARVVRMIEKEVLDTHPQALVLRTNVFGWAPTPGSAGLVESILAALQDEQPLSLDCMRHGTPILASDFVEVLEAAYQHRLHGLLHLGGGERINPFRFACLLADQFGYSAASLVPIETTQETRRKEFGAGETSLQTRRIRKLLDLPVPLIRDGLARLHEQHLSGYRERFGTYAELAEKVA